MGAETFRTVKEDLQALIDHAGTTAKTIPVPTLAIRAVLQPLDAVGRSRSTSGTGSRPRSPFYFDLGKTKAELGWQPRYSNAQALIRAYTHYLARPEASSASAHRRPARGRAARVLRG